MQLMAMHHLQNGKRVLDCAAGRGSNKGKGKWIRFKLNYNIGWELILGGVPCSKHYVIRNPDFYKIADVVEEAAGTTPLAQAICSIEAFDMVFGSLGRT